MKLPKAIFIESKRSDTLDIVLPGGSYGIETPFLKKMIKACKESGHSVLAFNFPYYERGDDHSSGPELKEELETIDSMMKKYHAEKYKQIRFVTKSLGGIVASYFLRKIPKSQHDRYSIIVLGYVLGSVDLKNFSGKIKIIQGGKDKFGNIGKVKKDFKNSPSKDISYVEIKGADHSFKNPDTGKSVFVNRATKFIHRANIRAAAILLKANTVLLMHRVNNGKEYLVFPGGGKEEDESAEEAVVREVLEEASIKCKINKLLYIHKYLDLYHTQYYYLCDYISGKPKLGNFNELKRMKKGKQTYNPEWVNLDRLTDLLLYPLEIKDWLIDDLRSNFTNIPKDATLESSKLRQEI